MVAALLAFNLSPWPGALLIRHVFEDGADNVREQMEKHAPDGVASILNEQYRAGDEDARLDVYFPESAGQGGEALPTLVWTHGGAWLSGHKDDAAPYLMLIASAGYTVISLDYSISPEHQYPRPVHQINDALAFIQQQAGRYHADPTRIVMAGDSAGAQLTSQVAAMITNPAFANELGITPAIAPEQLRGVILYCGIYDMGAFLDHDIGDLAADRTPMVRLLEWGTQISVWAYTGERDGDGPDLAQMSTIQHVTGAFPPTFISGGNGDPLTEPQSQALASVLQSNGVPVQTLFFPSDHVPSLPHEYQFNLDNADGQTAFSDMMTFLGERTGIAH
ncbi:MAG TPA: alpha/beta hydrolase [Thermomicrobiales bacterium]|nr:alpha/beta hydrolase [Thermomicrobiales bacterium]